MSTIYGGIFDFNIPGYTPPNLTGGVYNFTDEVDPGVDPGTLYQIYSDELLVYAATSNGVGIYDIVTGEPYAYINYADGVRTVCGNSDRVYIGTTNSGIKYVDKTTISGSILSTYDLTTHLVDLSTPEISASGIKYLSAKGNHLVACTTAGIDYFRFNLNPYIHSKTSVSGAQKCFATDDSIYYTVSGTNTTTSGMEYSLHRLDSCLTDWTTPTMTYTTNSGIFESTVPLKLTDVYITEGTAENGGNTIFCATSNGIYVIDEDSQRSAIYYTR
jgi:hypothetical protein